MVAVVLVVAVASASSLPAQEGAERAALDSVLGEISRIERPDAIPADSRCAAYGGPQRLLCQGFLATLRAEASGKADDANRAEFLIRQVVEARPQWALGWYALGIARLQQARAGVRAKEGPLQALGVSLEAGAGHALVRALEVEPTLAMAAEALALAPIPREGASQIQNRVGTLRRARAMLGPLELMGMAQVERLAGSRDTAVTLLEDALLTRGVDDGVVRLELARELHAVGRSRDGRMVLFAGAGFDSDVAKAAYRRELEWVAEPQEIAAWDSTVAAERPGWLQRFWAMRDVASGWAEGERLEEHYRRVEYAWANFTLVLPRSGRHQIRTRTGGIDTFVDDMIVQGIMAGEGIDAEFSPDADAATAFDAMRSRVTAEAMRVAGVDGPFRAFRSTQAVLDDRGVVHIRHGAPTRLATSVGGEALAVWVYDRDVGRLVLLFREENFDGQVGASTLVPSLLDVPARFRDQFCHLEPTLCASVNTVSAEDNRAAMGMGRTGTARQRNTMTDNNRLSTAMVQRSVEVGSENIVAATTTDAHPRTFSAKVTPAVQLYGLDRGGGDGPRAVAAFAIPGDQLVYTQPPAAGGRSVYSVRFRLSAVDEAGERRDLDTLRHFAVAAPLAKGQALQGVLEMPLPGGVQRMSLVLTQDDGRGAVASLGAIPVPRGGARLGISSLVLGREGSGVAWRSSTTTVPLNPINAFAPGSEATLYFQLHGLRAGQEYQTRLEFLDAAKPDARPALSLQFTEASAGERLEVLRTIGLKNLEPGRYRLRVTLTGAGSTVTETAWLTVSK
jgi:hypothetical protein